MGNNKSTESDEMSEPKYPLYIELLISGFVREASHLFADKYSIPSSLNGLFIEYHGSYLHWSNTHKAKNISLSDFGTIAVCKYSWKYQYSTIRCFDPIPKNKISAWNLNINLVRTWSGNQIFGIVSNDFNHYETFIELAEQEDHNIWKHLYGIDDAKGQIYNGGVKTKRRWKPVIPKQCKITVIANFTDPNNYTLQFILDDTHVLNKYGCEYSIKMSADSCRYNWYPSVTMTMDSTVTITNCADYSYFLNDSNLKKMK
eukprot:290618_1